MQIDKFVPRQLNTDSDQRYLEQGDLIDALNITLDEDGANSRIIVKNVRGTRAYNYNTPSDRVPEYPMTVIGSVSDSQRRRVYVFAASNTNDAAYDDIIFMIDMNTDQYQVVYRRPSSDNTDAGLRFDPNSFVKADVLNRDVQRDGTIQTLLYFTDNINPPRKINVDRALNGDYNQYTDGELRFVLHSIVPAPAREPSFTFETDTSVTENNLLGKCFQFATQFIFEDGEESAISPYSSLAFIDEAATTGITSGINVPAIFGVVRSENNVCVIDTKFATGYQPQTMTNESVEVPEVATIRVLAREDNDGAWFVIDEVSVDETTTRSIGGDDIQVFNPGSGLYRFYNDGAYRTISSLQSDKMYDNVPRIARGQAISGNRLVYSNYLEGYNNDNTGPDVTITPVYLGPESANGNGGISTANLVTFITSDSDGVTSSVDDDGSIRVDFMSMFSDAVSSTDPIEEGSQTVLQFTWTPSGEVSNTGTSGAGEHVLLQLEGVDSSGNLVRYGVGATSLGVNYDTIPIQATTPTDQNRFTINFVHVAGPGETVASLSDAFASYVENLTWTNRFGMSTLAFKKVNSAEDAGSGQGDGSTIAPDLHSLSNATIKQAWEFNTESTGGRTYIKPHIYFATVESAQGLYDTFETGIGGGGFDPNYGQQQTDWWNIQYQSHGFRGTDQTQEDYTFSGSVISNVNATSEAVNTELTFKSGASHEFGMVYFDRFMRHGPVIKLGSVYAQSIAERGVNVGKGAVHMQFEVQGSGLQGAPQWARSYKYLYAGIPFESVFSGVVSNAFVPTDAEEQDATGSANNASNFNPNRREIYVSIEGMEKTRKQLSSRPTYQFAEGDILRVIQYLEAATSTVQTPLSTTNTRIEFEVIRTVTLEDDIKNPLRQGQYSQGDLTAAGKTGRFLVLRAPEVDSGVQDANGDRTKYPGFDWFSLAVSANGGTVTNDNRYPYDSDSDGTNDAPTNAKYWKQECVVEILSPKKRTSDSVYYEISPFIGLANRRPEAGVQNGWHGPAMTTGNGGLFFRPVLSPRNQYLNTVWTDDPKLWQYKSITMESDRFSDRRQKADNGFGRPHLPLTEPQERRRLNGITYSEADVADLNTLFLSSFNKNTSNFYDLNPTFGALNYIGSMGEEMVGLQENKASRISVDRQIIQSADGQDVALALSASPFNVDLYYSGDYGCGNNPESVLIQDNQVFFADVSRSSVCRIASSQLFPISEKNTRSLFNRIFNNVRAAANPRIVSGYDPNSDMYYITFGNMGANNETVGYSVFGGDQGNGGWISRYSFYPTNYSNQDNSFLSMLYYDPDDTFDYDQQLMHVHDSGVYNTFYGGFTASDITYVSKIDPSRVHTFDALSHEGNSNNWNVQSINTDLMGANNANTLAFVEREGSYYAYITRDPGGTKHRRTLGVINSSTANTITFTSRINNQPVPANAELWGVSNGNLVSLSTTPNGTQVQVQSLNSAFEVQTALSNVNTATAINGTQVMLITPAALDSDPVRGHYATIRMTNNQTAQFELFCINTVLTMSQLHHYRGQ